MAENNSKRIWMLKYGKIIQYGEVLSVLLCIILMVKLFLNRSSHFFFATLILTFVFVILTYASSSYASLYKVVEKLPAPFVVNFDPLRTRVTVTDEKARVYMILHHERETENYPGHPEYYQVWTPLSMSSHNVLKNLPKRWEFLWAFLSPFVPSMLFNGQLKEVMSHSGREVKPISSLRAVGFVRERGNRFSSPYWPGMQTVPRWSKH